jgi:hypothetical protein
VQPFPATGAKYQIEGTSNFPHWSRDGRELFFTRNDQIFVVTVTTQPAFSFGNSAPVPGATLPTLNGLTPARQFDIAPDGTIISVVDSTQAPSGTPTAPRIDVVINWFEELKRLVPTN